MSSDHVNCVSEWALLVDSGQIDGHTGKNQLTKISNLNRASILEMRFVYKRREKVMEAFNLKKKYFNSLRFQSTGGSKQMVRFIHIMLDFEFFSLSYLNRAHTEQE